MHDSNHHRRRVGYCVNGFRFHSRSAHFNFEIDATNVFCLTFPSVATYACFFRFGQALWRNIKRLGLTDDYKSGSEVDHRPVIFATS